ncbi:DUF4097 family beta strand repeat-containing protein [Tranquillimonas alkanivorans]|uniref:Putative adhesin n=1 Tax=Tranquillimonas alkanivorans TaxID=441119 RepID=A0A1I5PB70_9RHOB|nr:DUF4097 family beta strand repeat-containing protein [Tranquillimonas alkanivorans]SFP31352.1 Putative adhesin [Tranquillimonas alkanivorans]
MLVVAAVLALQVVSFASTAVVGTMAGLLGSLGITSGVVDLVDEMRVLRKENRDLTTKNGNLRAENGKLETQNGNLKAENGKLESQNGNLRAENGELESQNGNLKAENGKLETQNGNLKAENRTLKTENGKLKDVNGRLKTANASLSATVAELKGQVADADITIEKQTTRIADLESNLGEANDMVAKQAGTLKDLRRGAGTLAEDISERTAKVAARNIASMPMESVPVLGAVTIVVVTGLEVYDACTTLRDTTELARRAGVKRSDFERRASDICARVVGRPSLPEEMTIEQCEAYADRAGREIDPEVANEVRQICACMRLPDGCAEPQASVSPPVDMP